MPLLQAPQTIAGMIAWWRSDQQVSTSGSNVTSWGDLSGNGHTANGPGGQQPTFNASDAAFGNKPSLSFSSATTQHLETGSFTINQPCTVYQCLANTNGNGGTFDCVFGGTIIRIRRFINQWDSNAGTDLFFGSGSSSASAVAAAFNGASSNIWVNSSAAPTAGNAGANNLTNGIAIGGNGASITSMDGAMVECIVYSGSHSNVNVATIFAYFASRYGIAAS